MGKCKGQGHNVAVDDKLHIVTRGTNPNNPAHPAHRDHLISTNGRTASRVWFPSTPILESVREELIQICNDHMRERCGFITSEWEVLQVDNVHHEPYRNFYMDENHTKKALEYVYEIRQESIIAMWHTHPNNVVWPSPRDLCGWPNPDLQWRYLIVTNNEVVEWELND